MLISLSLVFYTPSRVTVYWSTVNVQNVRCCKTQTKDKQRTLSELTTIKIFITNPKDLLIQNSLLCMTTENLEDTLLTFFYPILPSTTFPRT